MTPKEIYDRKKALKHERDMRAEEIGLSREDEELEAQVMFAAAIVSMERIADALEALVQSQK